MEEIRFDDKVSGKKSQLFKMCINIKPRQEPLVNVLSWG